MSVKKVEKAINEVLKTADNFGVPEKGDQLARRYRFVDPILRALGWRIHSPDECRLGFGLGWRGVVDYALLDGEGWAGVLIDVETWPARRRQHRNVLWRRVRGMRGGIAVLTYGLEWEIYDLSLRARSLDGKTGWNGWCWMLKNASQQMSLRTGSTIGSPGNISGEPMLTAKLPVWFRVRLRPRERGEPGLGLGNAVRVRRMCSCPRLLGAPEPVVDGTGEKETTIWTVCPDKQHLLWQDAFCWHWLFGQHVGHARFAYNWALGEFKAGLDVGEWLSERTLRTRWNKVKGMIAPWGIELSQNAAKYAIIDFGQAADSWGDYRQKVRAGRRVGFPRYKRRKHEQGFRADNGPDTVKVDGKVVILPKIGRVTMVEELRFVGSIREVTINRTAGTWFACFWIEDGQEQPPVKDGPTVGVDVGMGVMVTCSDGTVVENPKPLASALRRLRRVDKAIARSRDVHGKSNHSNRGERLYARRRNLHARMVNVRNDHHHKATTALAKSAGCVVAETLNVAGMMMNRRLARAITDAGMSGFLTKLEYKCSWNGAEFEKADRWFASSKLCPHCGWKKDDLTLSDREWWCVGCGVLNDRDANAADNLANWPGLRFPVSGRGDRVSPAAPAVVGEASNEPGETSATRGALDFIRFRMAASQERENTSTMAVVTEQLSGWQTADL